MSTPPNTYTDTPIASHVLANDQPVMRSNYTYIANTLGTSNSKNGDHQISIGGVDTNTFEGRHRQVCFNNRHGSAPTVAGISDGTNALLYADNGNIFFGSGLGAGAFQLTTFNSGANFGASPNGWTFLPSGLIMQYGIATVNTSGTATTISFPLTFPTAVLSITISCINNSGNSPSSNNVYVKSGSVVTNQFIVSNSSSGSVTSIYWMAIGN